jgi:N-acetyl-anhydromuramyl-L-alanine amidase AmpD
MRKVNKIVIHCTATREGNNVSPATIKKWHLARGFSDIGYHYIIGIEGTINAGRPVSKIGAHVKNGNRDSIGISYVGGLDINGKAKDTRTEEQKESLIKILKILKNIYPEASIHGHRDYSPDKDGDGVEEHEYMKQCPCYNAELEYLDLQPKSFKPKTKKVKDKLNGKKTK